MSGATPRDRMVASAAAQGLPPVLTDPTAADRVAAILSPVAEDPKPERSRAARRGRGRAA